jgi:S-formylglutathione hydrolase FrmB
MLRRCLAILPFLLIVAAVRADEPKPLEFHITFDKGISSEPFTGRVYVMLSRRSSGAPRPGPDWFNTEPFFAIDVKDWKPETPVVLGADALGYPVKLPQLTAGAYYAQAIMDFDRGSPHFGNAEGNGYSRAVRQELDPAKTGAVKLTIDQVARERRFIETDRVKLVDIESKLLTAFYGRPTRLRAAVIPPRSFKDKPEQKYPVIYEVPAFGGTHFDALWELQRNPTDVAGVEMLFVVPDPSCRWGHSVFADSDNNGPWGRALTEELIPHIEKEYRALGVATARFLTGHSSGGWSSLWLQVAYPDFFGGTWSTAPDPVDFRDFQRVNIYRPGTNIFTSQDGKPRPLARRGGEPILFYKPFSDMEVVMGHGGQLGSFEAVFSPRGPDGKPRKLWNRATGDIDTDVAKTWERYDIRLVLERDWQTLGPKLTGKLHVYMGAEDTFYLDGATILLKESLAKLGSNAKVEIFPGKDHSNLLDRSMRSRISREMAEQFRKHHGALPPP